MSKAEKLLAELIAEVGERMALDSRRGAEPQAVTAQAQDALRHIRALRACLVPAKSLRRSS